MRVYIVVRVGSPHTVDMWNNRRSESKFSSPKLSRPMFGPSAFDRPNNGRAASNTTQGARHVQGFQPVGPVPRFILIFSSP